MFTMLKKAFRGRPSAKAAKAASGFRPALEALESRDLMSVAGYSPAGQKDFYLVNSELFVRDQSGSVRNIATSVAQVSVLQDSAQIHPSARADVLFNNGELLQWDSVTGWK